MRDENCPECQRLWREYAEATTEHIRLDGKLKLAVLERNRLTIPSLTADVENALQRKSASRGAIRQHESSIHGGANEATPGGET